MSSALIGELASAQLASADAARLEIDGGEIELVRAWPGMAGQLLLEFARADGRALAGQWLADRSALDHVKAATAAVAGRHGVAFARAGETEVLLQAGGADRRLPALARLAARPGAALVAHRPERRGVVRAVEPGGVSFAKVMRPRRARAVTESARRAASLAPPALAVPRVCAGSPAAGVVVTSGLPGRSLHSLLAAGAGIEAAGAVGRALAAWHSRGAPDAASHRPRDEATVVEAWVERVAPYEPALAAAVGAAAEEVTGELSAARTPTRVALHRDLHDKQLMVSSSGQVGLIDLDTLAVGDPALDLANLLVHLELRALQRHCPAVHAAAAQRALLAGYDRVEGAGRLDLYADAARLRLACVYAFRPRWSAIPGLLLERVGRAAAGGLPDSKVRGRPEALSRVG